MAPANPDGQTQSTAPVVVGHEAHIVAEEDDGPRGDPSMPVSERNGYPNLILLCPTHHTLVDKDHGIHFSVGQLHEMKSDHEELVERRRVGEGIQQTFTRKRRELLLEAASASRARLVARWVAAGVRTELAQALADDDSVGAPARLSHDLPQTGFIVLEGDFGSGKSVTSERAHAADIATTVGDVNAPLAVYLSAKSVGGPLVDSVRAAAEGLGDPPQVGIRLTLDGLDEVGPDRAIELLDEARSLARMWPNSRVLATSRPGLELLREERLPYSPLSDEEAIALAERLGEDHRILWHRSEAVRHMLHLPLFLIVAVMRQQAGAEVPRSLGTFLEALADAALRRGQHPGGETRQALMKLARLTTELGGAVVAAELGNDEVIRSVLETRLVVRAARSLRFALPVVEQYFAARALLEAGLEGLDLNDLNLLGRWREAMTLAVTVGSWQQVSVLLEALAPVRPGLASWLVANAVPSSVSVATTELPGHIECARRLHRALACWVHSLGTSGHHLGLMDSTGTLRTVGAFVAKGRVTAAMKLGDNLGVDAVQLPFGLNPFTAAAPDGSEWLPYRNGEAPIDFMAWPWQWSLDWISSGLERVLRMRSLPLPNTKPFQDERRWQITKAIMGRIGSVDHRPFNAGLVRQSAEQLMSAMDLHSAQLFKPNPRRNIRIAKEEITRLIAELRAGDVVAEDGKVNRPYPAPDILSSRSTHISNLYSDEALRSLVERVYTNALVIYHDLVTTWFPAFAPTLGLASILPVAFRAKLLPNARPWGDPDFVYRMEPLPPNEVSGADVQLVAKHEDLIINVETMIEQGRKLRELIAALHPGAQAWANPRSYSATLYVYGDLPATTQAYQWLWEDLLDLHTIKQIAPIGED